MGYYDSNSSGCSTGAAKDSRGPKGPLALGPMIKQKDIIRTEENCIFSNLMGLL